MLIVYMLWISLSISAEISERMYGSVMLLSMNFNLKDTHCLLLFLVHDG